MGVERYSYTGCPIFRAIHANIFEEISMISQKYSDKNGIISRILESDVKIVFFLFCYGKAHGFHMELYTFEYVN